VKLGKPTTHADFYKNMSKTYKVLWLAGSIDLRFRASRSSSAADLKNLKDMKASKADRMIGRKCWRFNVQFLLIY
jgi:hypothetical protein